MRKFTSLGLGLQGTPHDLRACPNHRLLQLLADDLLWYVLYVFPFHKVNCVRSRGVAISCKSSYFFAHCYFPDRSHCWVIDQFL